MSIEDEYGSKEWFEWMFSDSQNGIDNWGHQWRASQKYRYLLSVDIIRPLLKKKSAQSIMDIGCGLADFTQLMYGINNLNKFYGMDISQNAIKYAKKKYPNFQFVCTALPEIAFQKKFDGIISLDCIYYLSHQSRIDAVKNIYKRLKTNGWYLFSSPIDNGTRYFSKKQAIDLLQIAGFNVNSICYNNTRIYNLFEIPFLKIIKLQNIIHAIEQQNKIVMTPNKESIRRSINIPILGNINKYTIDILNALSCKILSSMLIIKIFQRISRKILREQGVSHIFVLSFKKE
jgi:2-polyprenyl-3-methyl-5-hydroxy-6-metoxy-1,4-benzoquinol methylase